MVTNFFQFAQRFVKRSVLLLHELRTTQAIAVLAAVLTPTGDVLTMSVFAGPMILLYLLGVGVSWVSQKRQQARAKSGEAAS